MFRKRKIRMETVVNNVPRTVLVVDSFEPVLEVAEGYLESEGFCVFTASSGIDALRIAQQYAGAIDLLLTEEQLPAMNGATVAARLKLLRPELAVIVMSTAMQGKTYEEFEEQHGALFLWKPFTKAELLLKVRAALQAKQNGSTAGATDSRVSTQPRQ